MGTERRAAAWPCVHRHRAAWADLGPPKRGERAQLGLRPERAEQEQERERPAAPAGVPEMALRRLSGERLAACPEASKPADYRPAARRPAHRAEAPASVRQTAERLGVPAVPAEPALAPVGLARR